MVSVLLFHTSNYYLWIIKKKNIHFLTVPFSVGRTGSSFKTQTQVGIVAGIISQWNSHKSFCLNRGSKTKGYGNVPFTPTLREVQLFQQYIVPDCKGK